MEVANTLAYYDTAKITALKIIVQAHGYSGKSLFTDLGMISKSCK
jgi:hypothetical protein